MADIKLFISCVQREFANERRQLKVSDLGEKVTEQTEKVTKQTEKSIQEEPKSNQVSPKTGETFKTSNHEKQEVATGTLRNILKSAGLL